MDATLLGQKPSLHLPDTLNILINSFIFIKKKNAFLMWFELGEKQFAKRRIRTPVDYVKRSMTHALLSALLELMTDNCLL